ncbi:MAG: Predicted L-lactate dehydrogenase, hypothetical protein subunit YkgG [uncultured Caballeronia sp.]|nr:MAG: Predicted L-lactate dehydrogenase, hypothetical protein subunit YkgG [uncultured Caballeronia sp.]
MDTSAARRNILARIRSAQGRRGAPSDAERLSTTVAEVDSLADAPAEAARYLESLNLPTDVVAWPALSGLPFAEAGLRAELHKPADADLVGITGCFCATAETGSLVLLSGALLPQTHIAIVPASRIVASHEEDAFALMRAERGELPRAVNFVSGSSRTGDIEQTIVLGAHGPYRVHVIVARGA